MSEPATASGRSGYFGDFGSWREAEREARGFGPESVEIAARLMQRVVDREVAYVRDGVEFERIELPYPLLAFLLRIAVESDCRLALVDFGGNLGTTYHQTRGFLSGLRSVRWGIVELPEFVACGRQRFTTHELSFHDSLAEARAATGARTVLLSGVLPYLPDPDTILRQVVALGFQNVIFDRTALLVDGERSRIVLQAIPGPAGEFSWPVRLTSRADLLAAFGRDYEVIAEFDSYCDPPGAVDGLRIAHRGLVLRRVREAGSGSRSPSQPPQRGRWQLAARVARRLAEQRRLLPSRRALGLAWRRWRPRSPTGGVGGCGRADPARHAVP